MAIVVKNGEVQNGRVSLIVQVEVTFQLSDGGIEGLIEEGALFSAWPNGSDSDWETAQENAEKGVNKLPKFVQDNLLEMSDFESEIIQEIENNLGGEIQTANGVGEIGGVWVE